MRMKAMGRGREGGIGQGGGTGERRCGHDNRRRETGQWAELRREVATTVGLNRTVPRGGVQRRSERHVFVDLGERHRLLDRAEFDK